MSHHGSDDRRDDSRHQGDVPAPSRYSSSSQGAQGPPRGQRNPPKKNPTISIGTSPEIKNISKKDLLFNTQTFAERPNGFIFDKKNIGMKTQLLTNHVIVNLPDETLKLYCYNIEVFLNNRPVKKREKASPIFWDIVRRNRNMFPSAATMVYNDCNMLYCTEQLATAEGNVFGIPNQKRFEFKYTGRVDFGKTIREDQDRQLLATIIDAIATARVRTDCLQYSVFKRCLFVINNVEDETLVHPLTSRIRSGLDARVGVSIAIRLNLRAGITACFDTSHTIFTRRCYPLIRLLCEVINDDVISDQDFRGIWDMRLRNWNLNGRHLQEMDRILQGHKLRYSFESGVRVREDGEETDPGLEYFNERGKMFSYFQFTPESARDTTFVLNEQNGRRTLTVAQYFLERYHIRLRYPNLPCLVKKPTRRNDIFICFPLEFVTYGIMPVRYSNPISELNKIEYIQKTTYSMMERRQLLDHIMRQNRIADCPEVVDNEDRYMRHYNLSFGKEMLTVNATMLPPPTVVYGEGSKFTDDNRLGKWEAVIDDPPRKVLEGSTDVRNQDKTAPKKTKRLLGSVLNVISPVNEGLVMDWDVIFYHRIMAAVELAGQPVAFEPSGLAAIQGCLFFNQKISQPSEIPEFFASLKNSINDPKNDKYKENENEVLIPFVIVVFQARCTTMIQRTRFDNDYNYIKYHADNNIGIYTQGILINNLVQIHENPVYCKLTHLMVEKILGKVGTTHRKLERNGDHKTWTKLTDPDSPCLILGVDVSHPSPHDRLQDDIRRLSIATVVGNIDTDCCEYRASSRIQDSGQETIVSFKDEVSKRINDFITNNSGKRPAHIVVYRDGLAESDFKRTLYEERINIENACLELDMEYQPTITYIVSTKRHHTRFFLKDLREGDEAQGYNLRPGTLVEDTVTTTDFYDFYLSTQVGQLGLARPIHYYVLWDTWKPMPSFWPTITHAFTYLFCRTTSTVALPAPVLYAHLAAKRAKECMDGAWLTAPLEGVILDISNYADVNRLTRAINVNPSLDGMNFV